MWLIVKAELKYYRVAFAAPIFYAILFQIGEFFISKTISGMENIPANDESANIGDGFYSFVLLFSFFSIMQRRIKEKRERFFVILPLSSKQLALSRFWFVVIPIIIVMFYFVFVNIVVINVWHIELSIPLLHLGIIFILFSGFIRARDDWFSHWSFGKRIHAAFVSVLVIQVLVVGIFLNIPDASRSTIPMIGDYAEIIFFLLGLTIMITTIFSYIKRKSYLS